ncbi:unnamed protein product [Acanthoscelides obtectus]|uniref:Uncharacterized protein n=1 Tax=Acanthoscelides obtectus TaxID=200917 RepID=A0A9P0MFP6_ACAOB|nr:unnamed protein product [Acanthoscelides obtectus]CAK1659568.1 hypothetical protein AOBTE_LOCUS21544 [Acanthoscelides obtectus]
MQVTYIVALKIAKSGRPFTDGALVKECLVECAEILCPSPVTNFESEQTISRRILELGADLKEQLRGNVPILWSIL